MKLLRRTLLTLTLFLFAYALTLAGIYLTIPNHNTPATHYDTIIVLGSPSKMDGTPTPELRERVLEGVREYKAGIAPRLIMTGGPAHNHYVEAHVMAQFAAAQGVPPADILEEGRAQNTIQNIAFSSQLMHQHNWSSAEIVSSPSHLPRTALIVNHLDTTQPTLSIDWHTHPALWPAEYNLHRKINLYYGEAVYCFKLRLHGFPLTPTQTSPAPH